MLKWAHSHWENSRSRSLKPGRKLAFQVPGVMWDKLNDATQQLFPREIQQGPWQGQQRLKISQSLAHALHIVPFNVPQLRLSVHTERCMKCNTVTQLGTATPKRLKDKWIALLLSTEDSRVSGITANRGECLRRKRSSHRVMGSWSKNSAL